MKVLVLGGAGAMGRTAARESAGFPFVDVVTVADLNGGGAARVAGEIGAKARGLKLDINDRAAMRAAIEAHDVVLNTIGPFYLLGVPVLDQVIDARRNYADICDDWEPTLDMLALSEKAKSKSVVALVGLGASPGVTNMLALLAARDLDEVDEVLTGWSITGDPDAVDVLQSAHPKANGAGAATVHWVQQLTGSIRVLRDGGFQDVKPLERREIHYPGRGVMPVWTVGHPEAVTLPRTLHGLRACANVMIGPRKEFDGLRLIAGLVNTGILTARQAADEIHTSMQKDRDKAARGAKAPADDLPMLFGWARGRFQGRPAAASVHMRAMPPGGMAGATSVPLSLALPLFKRGFGSQAGVFTPEELIDPTTFLDLLAPKCAGGPSAAEGAVQRGRAFLDG